MTEAQGERSNGREQATERLVVVPHQERLDEIVGILLDARSQNAFPYDLDSARLPHDERHMPPGLERGGRDHANFLWASCYWMRGGIKSTTAFLQLSKMYEHRPDLFQPEVARYANPGEVEQVLQHNGLYFLSNSIKDSWVENARRLDEIYGGDPRAIFEGVTNYDDLLKRIKNNQKGGGFVGFQEKMVSMIAYYLMDAKLVPYFDFPLPVDFHVLRVSAATDIITFKNVPKSGDIYSPQTLATLREMYHDYSVRHGVSQLDVCNAVWSLSSAICGIQPGNRMTRISGEARSTVLEPHSVDYTNTGDLKAYSRSCLHCPIESYCSHNFPSKVYYVLGKMIGSERQRPLDDDPSALFSINALAGRITRE